MMAEAAVTAAVQRELARRGAWAVKIHGAGVGRNGVPDILACYRGRMLAIECKSATGWPTKLQAHELERIARAGGWAVVVRGVEDVRAVLDRIEEECCG
jgi:Holliday junction resolvase